MGLVKEWSSIKLSGEPILLLGNGASRAIDDEAFDYKSLLNRAKLSTESQSVFELVGNSDFEQVLLRLEITKETNRALKLADKITAKHIEEIRNGLVRAVRSIHPTLGVSLDDTTAGKAIRFLSHFKAVFTLNYDFFLYWLINKANQSETRSRYFKDGFWDGGKFDFSNKHRLELEREGLPATVCYYMHGALQLVDEPEQKLFLSSYDELKKTKLTDKIQAAWANGRRPLFVSEGKSSLKLRRIETSVYLRHAFEEFKRLIKQKDLVIYGASLSEQDQHLVDAINDSEPKNVFVSLHNPEGVEDPRLKEWEKKITSSSVYFFNVSSNGAWIY